MTIWVVWFLAIGLVFGLGLASSRSGHNKDSAPIQPKGRPSRINAPTNEAKAASPSNVSALSQHENKPGLAGTPIRQNAVAEVGELVS